MSAAQAAAASKGSQLAIETAVPIGSVLLVAALSALAAYTGRRNSRIVHHACTAGL